MDPMLDVPLPTLRRLFSVVWLLQRRLMSLRERRFWISHVAGEAAYTASMELPEAAVAIEQPSMPIVSSSLELHDSDAVAVDQDELVSDLVDPPRRRPVRRLSCARWVSKRWSANLRRVRWPAPSPPPAALVTVSGGDVVATPAVAGGWC
eukprot:CAMPEP_0181135126 /NCGR_PEP_ID=MMETSP1071-20121207/32457_1 /TAXON_ID=35127 /ORGANISM="Thalassiosira sp., Strain NH16" /LENGTH=149 /DNA_ID=CAMNT_0023221695 /DNA_START=476 /DNA_END=925 /DNA_ORIENTATION=+